MVAFAVQAISLTEKKMMRNIGKYVTNRG